MQVQKRITVSRKIIKEDDLIRIATLLEGELSSIEKGQNAWAYLRLTLTSDDGSTFIASDLKELQSSDGWKVKRIVSIEMRLYTSSDIGKTLSIELSHGNASPYNKVFVEGPEPNWVRGVVSGIQDALGAARPQSAFISQHSLLIVAVTALGIGRLLVQSWLWINDFLKGPAPNPSDTIWATLPPLKLFGVAVLVQAFLLLVGVGPAMWLFQKAEELWPSIEFQIGPEHKHTEKRRRLLISSIFLLGILPLLLSVLHDLLRGLGLW